MKIHLLLLLHFSLASTQDIEILTNYTNALQNGQLSSILAPNFKLTLCDNTILDQAKIEYIYKNVDKEYFKFREYTILETTVHGEYRRYKVNVSGLLTTYYDVKGSQIITEIHRDCAQHPVTTSMIDDTAMISSLSLDKYLEALRKPSLLSRFLKPDFVFSDKTNETTAKYMFISKIKKLESPVTYSRSEMVITKSWYIPNNKRFGYIVRLITSSSIVEAEILLEADRDFRIISERQLSINSTSDPLSTAFIDYDGTAEAIARSLTMRYFAAIHSESRRMFQKIVSPQFRVIDNKARMHFIRSDEYFTRILMLDEFKSITFNESTPIPKNYDLAAGTMQFWVYTNYYTENNEQVLFTAHSINNTYLITWEQRIYGFTAPQYRHLTARLPRRLQTLLDKYVAAINSRNITQFREIAAYPYNYRIGMRENRSSAENFLKDGNFTAFFPSKMPSLVVADFNFNGCKNWIPNTFPADLVAVAEATNITFKVQFLGKDLRLQEEFREPEWKSNYEKNVLADDF